MYTEVARKGFTLIELLVVIAIIALLAAVVALAINPVEMLKRGRDSRRLSELEALRKAIDFTLADGGSLADFTDPSDSAEVCPATVASRSAAGTGWLNYVTTGWPAGISLGNYLAVLPVDPSPCTQALEGVSACDTGVGIVMSGNWRYRFERSTAAGAGYIVMATMESQVNAPKCLTDGGSADGWVEIGNDPGLCGGTGETCGN